MARLSIVIPAYNAERTIARVVFVDADAEDVVAPQTCGAGRPGAPFAFDYVKAIMRDGRSDYLGKKKEVR